MKKYESYKDSGIEWIGEIPSHWDIVPIKYSLKIPLTDGPHETPELVSDGVTFISAEAIKEDNIDFSKRRGNISFADHERFSKKYKPERGDVYMVKSGATTGNLARVQTDEEFNIWSPLAAFRPHPEKITTDFLFFFMKSKRFFTAVELGWNYGTQQNIGMNVLENLRMVRPPVDEQTTIATYLDRKTAEIDELIADKKRLLELYEEEKTALINQAVTKGINPDVPMKDSGIEWLGKIPEHWEVKRLKYVASINDEVLTEKTEEDYEIEYVEISGVKSGLGIVETSNYRFKDAPSRARRVVRVGDVLVSTVRTYLKSIAKVDSSSDNLIASTGFAVVRSRKIDSDYTGYLFYSEPLIGEIISLSTGVSYPAINSSQIGDISIPIPSIEEQQYIAQQIDTDCQRIDLQVERTQKLIDLLKEYREALISEVVTGHIKVID